jgi:hypothetical protein
VSSPSPSSSAAAAVVVAASWLPPLVVASPKGGGVRGGWTGPAGAPSESAEARRAGPAAGGPPPGSVTVLLPAPPRPDPLGASPPPPPGGCAYASLASLDRVDRWPSGLGGVAVTGEREKRGGRRGRGWEAAGERVGEVHAKKKKTDAGAPPSPPSPHQHHQRTAGQADGRHGGRGGAAHGAARRRRAASRGVWRNKNRAAPAGICRGRRGSTFFVTARKKQNKTTAGSRTANRAAVRCDGGGQARDAGQLRARVTGLEWVCGGAT